MYLHRKASGSDSSIFEAQKRHKSVGTGTRPPAPAMICLACLTRNLLPQSSVAFQNSIPYTASSLSVAFWLRSSSLSGDAAAGSVALYSHQQAPGQLPPGRAPSQVRWGSCFTAALEAKT